MLLSTSPRDVQSFLEHKTIEEDAPFLNEFLRNLPHAIHQRKQKELSHNTTTTTSSSKSRSDKDPITELFQ